MVAWSKNQESGLQTETFMLLLHKLGFHLATDVGKCFPRIPHFWSADHLYNLALKVGPLRKEELKMDLSLMPELGSSVTEIANEEAESSKKPTAETKSDLSPVKFPEIPDSVSTATTVDVVTSEYSPFAM